MHHPLYIYRYIIRLPILYFIHLAYVNKISQKSVCLRTLICIVHTQYTITDVMNGNGGLTGFFGIFCCKKWLTTMRRSTRTAPDRAEYTKPALPVLVCSLDEYGLMIRQMLVKPSI